MIAPYWTSRCGRHVLYNADCLEVLPGLQGVDAVVTDPPWNCGYFGASDSATWGEYKETLRRWLAASESIASGQVWFLSTKSIFHVSDLFDGYKPFASVKNFSQMMPTALPNCWDIAFIKSTEYLGNGRNWFLCNTAGMLQERTGHPTPRTVDVMEYVLGMHGWGTVCDPFTGSGTTGVACIRTGRRFIGIEISREYCDIAVKRMERELSQPKLPGMEPERMVQRELLESV